MIQVRPWQPGDEDQIRRVVRQVFDEYKFAWDPYGYHQDLYRLDSKYAGFWVAQEPGGTLVGVCGVSCFSPIPGEPGQLVEHKGELRVAGADCEMKRLYVLGRARGKGVGRRLAQAALDFAAERGQTLMEIWSDKLFTEAHGLYKGLGAEVVGERIDSSPDQAEEWGMALPLTPRPFSRGQEP
jgi:GNAT superfamily N-acetyltransferase